MLLPAFRAQGGSELSGGVAPMPRVNLDADGRSLQDVIHLVTLQSGVTVDVDKKWADLKVKGSYENVSLDEFFRRVLKGENYTILFDDLGKLVSVQSFGKRSRFSYARWAAPSGVDAGEDELDAEMSTHSALNSGRAPFDQEEKVNRFYAQAMGLGPSQLGGRLPIHHYSRIMAVKRHHRARNHRVRHAPSGRLRIFPDRGAGIRVAPEIRLHSAHPRDGSRVASTAVHQPAVQRPAAENDEPAQIPVVEQPRPDYLEVYHFFEREAGLH